MFEIHYSSAKPNLEFQNVVLKLPVQHTHTANLPNHCTPNLPGNFPAFF